MYTRSCALATTYDTQWLIITRQCKIILKNKSILTNFDEVSLVFVTPFRNRSTLFYQNSFGTCNSSVPIPLFWFVDQWMFFFIHHSNHLNFVLQISNSKTSNFHFFDNRTQSIFSWIFILIFIQSVVPKTIMLMIQF